MWNLYFVVSFLWIDMSNVFSLWSYYAMNYAVDNKEFGLDIEDYLVGEFS